MIQRPKPLSQQDIEIARMRDLQHRMRMVPLPDIFIGVKLVSKEGKVLEDRYEQGHSWTRNAWNWWATSGGDCLGGASTVFGEGNLNFTSTSGSVSLINSQFLIRGTPTASSVGNGFIGASNAYAPGIVIGNSAEPFSAEDYNMWSPVLPGTGSNQMVYGAMVAPTYTYNSTSKTYSATFTRVFNNNSAASITVNECGLTYSTSGHLMSRDVFSSPIVASVGSQLTISITIVTSSFAALEAAAITQPALYSSVGGGINLGTYYGWRNSPALGLIGAHPKFLLILSPKTGGESSPLLWRTSNTGQSYVAGGDASYGKTESDYWQSLNLGTATPAIDFMKSANLANLGGYSDWYLPWSSSSLEMTQYMNATVNSSLPVGERLETSGYFGIPSSGAATISTFNGQTGANLSSGVSFTSASARVRLIRRHKFT